MNLPQSQYVVLHGRRFHFLDHGNAGAPPLVLLHGFSSHAHSWDTFANAVRDRYHVLALDQRGHGESAWFDDYAPERMVEDVALFAKALRLDRFALLGLSMGGRNAYHFAGLHTTSVEKLVIVDIGPEVTEAGATRIQTGVQAPDIFDSPDQAYARARAASSVPPEDEQKMRTYYNLMRTEDGHWTWRWDSALRNPDRPRPRSDPAAGWQVLTGISCPTLLVRGQNSDLLSPEIADRMTQTIPNCRFVQVPNAGHSVSLDNPAGFIAAVRPFLLGRLP